MTIKSINEPGTSRTTAMMPLSINEPTTPQDWIEAQPPGTLPEVPPGATTPVVTGLEPAECRIGDESFTVAVIGTGFLPSSVMVFAGQDEPTTFVDPTRVTTGVNMDVWHGPDTVKVSVRNGDVMSNEVDFTFHPEAEPEAAKVADPDDLEEEIEAAEDDGDFTPMHRGRPTTKLPTRRKT